MIRLMGILVLVLAIAGLLKINWQFLTTPIDTSPILIEQLPTNEQGRITRVKQSQNDDESDEASFQSVQTLSRPLFNPTRRPFRKQVKKTVKVVRAKQKVIEAKAAPQPDLELLGVSAGPDSTRALVKMEGQDAQWVQKSDSVENWTIGNILPHSITLVHGKQTAHYELFPSSETEKNIDRSQQSGATQ